MELYLPAASPPPGKAASDTRPDLLFAFIPAFSGVIRLFILNFVVVAAVVAAAAAAAVAVVVVSVIAAVVVVVVVVVVVAAAAAAAVAVVIVIVVVVVVVTALHAMQTQSSDENSVRLSVRLSNACIVTKGKKVLSRFLYDRKDHLA